MSEYTDFETVELTIGSDSEDSFTPIIEDFSLDRDVRDGRYESIDIEDVVYEFEMELEPAWEKIQDELLQAEARVALVLYGLLKKGKSIEEYIARLRSTRQYGSCP